MTLDDTGFDPTVADLTGASDKLFDAFRGRAGIAELDVAVGCGELAIPERFCAGTAAGAVPTAMLSGSPSGSAACFVSAAKVLVEPGAGQVWKGTIVKDASWTANVSTVAFPPVVLDAVEPSAVAGAWTTACGRAGGDADNVERDACTRLDPR